MHDRKQKGARDGPKIVLQEVWQLDYWTIELGVSKDELERLIKKVGSSADAVRRELGLGSVGSATEQIRADVGPAE
jgi:predicted RNA-binding protein YlqC (UPF0109 family)